MHKDHKTTLAPLALREVSEDQLKMRKKKRKAETKEKRKIKWKEKGKRGWKRERKKKTKFFIKEKEVKRAMQLRKPILLL